MMRSLFLLLAAAATLPAFAQMKRAESMPAPPTPQGVVAESLANRAPKMSDKLQSDPNAPPARKASAVRVAAEREAALPGVGMIPGAKEAIKPQVIQIDEDRNEYVYVSTTFPNRIATPFPRARSVQRDDLDIMPVGSSLYYTPKNGNPEVVYITGDQPGDPVINLTLVPRDLPSQTIKLQMNTPVLPAAAKGEEEGVADGYTDKIRAWLRSVALGKAPSGFVEAGLPTAIARMGTLIIEPVRRYAGSTMDIFRYRVENVGQDPVELSETAFSGAGVRAVGIIPKLRLERGESSFILILSDKDALTAEGRQ